MPRCWWCRKPALSTYGHNCPEAVAARPALAAAKTSAERISILMAGRKGDCLPAPPRRKKARKKKR
jgi:hypothetical protein